MVTEESINKAAQEEVKEDNTKWYVLRVVNGKEKKVKE